MFRRDLIVLNRAFICAGVLSMTLASGSFAQAPASEKALAQPAEKSSGPDSAEADPKPEASTAKSGKDSATGGAVKAPAPAQNALPPITGGDKIFMVSGSVMTGVQVLRSTPRVYVIQMIEGQEPLEIPRRQVKSVEYDDIDPTRDRLRKELFPEEKEVTIASGERVTGALRDKLMAPVSAEALAYKEQDFITVLDEIKTKTGVNLTIDPSIEEKPANQRRWTVEVASDKTLMALLREDLVGAFNYVEVIFEADAILVTTKVAAKAREEEKAKATGDAPTDGAEAPADAKTPPADVPAAPAAQAPAPAPGGLFGAGNQAKPKTP